MWAHCLILLGTAFCPAHLMPATLPYRVPTMQQPCAMRSVPLMVLHSLYTLPLWLAVDQAIVSSHIMQARLVAFPVDALQGYAIVHQTS